MESSLTAKAIGKGECKIFLRKKGEAHWKKVRKISNITVNLGLNLIRNNIFTTQTDYVQWGAVSDNSTSPAPGDNNLGGNEIRTSFQSAVDISTNYQATANFFIDGTMWANGSPSALTSVKKAGLYYKVSGNYLYCAASFESITVDSNTEMLVQWVVKYADA